MTQQSSAVRHADRPHQVAEEAAAARSADLLDALVAAYALMAHADGEVAPAERRRLFAVLRETPALSVVPHEQIVEQVAVHEANFRLDPELAQVLARERLAPVAGRRADARSVVTLCRALIPADGVAHPAEYRMLHDIKAQLGFDDAPGATPTGRS